MNATELAQRRARLASRRAGLSQAQQTQLETALRQAPVEGQPTIRPRPTSAEAPLSFAQQRLWFLEQLQPDAVLYNVPLAVQIVGPLEVVALQQSINAITARHEVLRTNFIAPGGQPEPVVRPPRDLGLQVVDLSGLSRQACAEQSQRLASEQGRRRFDLAKDALLRTALVCHGRDDYAVLLSMHHIICDGWSMGIFVREMGMLYRSFGNGVAAHMPPLAIQYADYSYWQRQWLQGERLQAEVAFWRDQLGEAPALDLPTDRPRPRVQSFKGGNRDLRLSPDLTARLRVLCREEGSTLFIALLAAFQVLLSRYSGQDDIVVGSPVAGRNSVEVEGLIGPFLNTLVLRTRLTQEATAQQLIRTAREVVLAAQAHQDLPFEKIVEELKPERGVSQGPLFQVMFILQNAPPGAVEVKELTFRFMEVDAGTARFDLTLSFIETGEGLGGGLSYATDLFDAVTVERMAAHLEAIVAGMVGDPDHRVSTLPLLTEAARHQVLIEWNVSQADPLPEPCLHELIQTQAGSKPDAVAIVAGAHHLSFRELNVRTNQLGRYLQSLGIGGEALVGACLDRSLEMVIGLLGILKAGGAYVPLDPQYPAERLQYMVADSGLRLVLTQNHLVDKLPDADVERLCLDGDWLAISRHSIAEPPGRATSDNTAYVIYTSGSTGGPKGVQVRHRALNNFLDSMSREPGLSSDAILLAVTSPGFDIAGLEIFLPLLAGARLVVASRQEVIDGKSLVLRLRESGATMMQATPSTWRLLLDAGWPGEPNLHVLCGGEALLVDLANRLRASAASLWNLYGPTETTIWSTLSRVDQNAQAIHLGRPIQNTQVYLLDHQTQPVPLGVRGELHIGGEGLAMGYLNRPELTAERFVPDPFSGRRGARLYKTGDLARYLGNGQLDYRGRADHQVKLRGYRIELGEIEAALCAHPAVAQAAVVTSGSGVEQRLLAYVVAAPGEPMGAAQLRAYLGERLPDYMQPAAYVELAELPLTPNGKLDRRRLPEVVVAGGGGGAGDEAEGPRGMIEEMVAGIWMEVLGVERVGREENFFWMGGQSLLAAAVVARVREAVGVEVGVASVFERPTVAGLSEAVEEEMRGREPRQRRPEVKPRPRPHRMPLSFAQQRLWLLDQMAPGNSAYNLFAAMRLDESINPLAVEQGLSEVERRHEGLRVRFVWEEGEAWQEVVAAISRRLPVVDLSRLSPQEQERLAGGLAQSELRRPFNLANDKLLRSFLVSLSGRQYLLMLTVHHIVCDGRSMAIFAREMRTLYDLFAQGAASPLPEFVVQYLDYVYWQREWLKGEALSAELSYWRQQLADAPPALELLLDRPRPAVASFRGAHYPIRISAPLTDGLRALSRQESVTLFMTLLAGFQILLARHTRQSDIVVGTPIEGRNHVEFEGLIGLFVNTLVLRTDLTSSLSVRDVLRRVRQVALDAFMHQDLPFEKLVEELQPQCSLSHMPLFQVMFTFGQGVPTFEALGGSARLPAADAGTAKFDLTLGLHDRGDALLGSFEYCTDLFDATTVARLAGHLQALLEGLVSRPDQAVARLPLLLPSERHQLACEWNQPASTSHPRRLLHEMVGEQAARRADAIAVVSGGEQLSYSGLWRAAGRLAKRLRRLGVRDEELVGLCIGRGVGQVVGALGVLRAGGGYVPLEAGEARQRQSYMVSDSGVRVVVVGGGEEAGEWEGVKVVAMEEEGEAGEGRTAESMSGREAEGSEERLAYVIYTSGSTGKPKGVMVSHANVTRLFSATAPWFQFGAGDTWTLFHSYAFDFSVWEMFGALLYGGRLVVVPYWVSRSPAAFSDLLREERVTVLCQTPSAFRQLMTAWQAGGGAEYEAMRFVIFGGEALEFQTLKPWYERHGEGRPALINMYGITETTVHVTYRPVAKEEVERAHGSAIGRAIEDLGLYLLDGDLEPMAIGVEGKLYVGGAGLARGYLHQPALTAERFVPDPFSGRRGARLYKTGDLARYLGNGQLDYRGRADHQVKLRGYRIELGEIEAALVAASGGGEAAVVVVEGAASGLGPRLVGFVVSGGVVEPGGLRRRLEERLPGYMVPSRIEGVARLPLTANGKVDRRRLAQWAAELEPVAGGEGARAEGVIEEVVAGIWATMLGCEEVGAEANFFELGGQSLLAARVVARVRESLGVEVSLRQLFERPTVRGLAQVVKQGLGSGAMAAEAIQRRERVSGRAAASYGQQRLWLLQELEGGGSRYNVGLGLRLRGRVQGAALWQSFRGVVRRHEGLRTVFEWRGEGLEQVISEEVRIEEVEVEVKGLRAEERARVVGEVRRQVGVREYDLRRGPVMRVVRVVVEEEEEEWAMGMHHIVSDGWSMKVVEEEVKEQYEANKAGEPAKMEELEVQYADYAAWQRGRLEGGEMARQLAYWREQLAGASDFQLPTDKKRPGWGTSPEAVERLSFPSALSNKLSAISRQEGATLYMGTLVAFKILLSAYTGKDDIMVGSPVANRTHRETERLIGCFINTLVLRTRIDLGLTFCENLRRVRETALAAYTHQDLPFEKLVEALRPERRLQYNPFFQILFDYHRAARTLPALSGLSVSVVEPELDTAKFDLSLNIMENQQGLAACMEYNADLFHRSTITRMLADYLALLESIVADPERRLHDLLSGLDLGRKLGSPESQNWLQEEVEVSINTREALRQRRTDLAARRAKLPAAKRALLESRVQEELK